MRGLTLLACLFAAVAPANDLERLRESGNLSGQRAHVWQVIAALTQPDARGAPTFQSWHGEDEVFGDARAADASFGSAGAPVLTYTLYNAGAYAHIQSNRLQVRAELERLHATATAAITDFPDTAVVLKTAWWPVARDALTVLPVWDPESNRARAGGNPYPSWQRIVLVDARGKPTNVPARAEFAGRTFAKPRAVSLDSFHHIAVDSSLARRVLNNREASKIAFIALGRPIEAGDRLVLVGVNLATRELRDWLWAALWWHDMPERGEFAADRPPDLAAPWRNLLMQVAFDAVRPVRADGSAHVCFNPWFEARFPDAGRGGGTVSNCIACHNRASFPPRDFLPVTRGAEDPRDPAHAPDQLRTSLLWSLPMHATH